MNEVKLDRTLLPSWANEAPWVEKGEVFIPKWLVTWSQAPCDMLILGSMKSLLIPYVLLTKIDSSLEEEEDIVRVSAIDINPFRSFDQQRKDRDAWGHELPIGQQVLMLTDVIFPLPERQIGTLSNLIRARRGRNLLTIAQSPLSLSEWNTHIKISFPMAVSDGTT